MLVKDGSKFKYIKVLQGNYGYGWDDLVEYENPEDEDVKKEIKSDWESYQKNESYPHRIIQRRILVEE